ncbi:MAG TPA: flagellar hook-length control protein FliK, partial [Acidimicrobiales bacterium]
HRVVLRLDPEHLGEVRITLTVHPGGVRVRMSTGTEDARAALSDGLHALHRALETVPGRPAGDTQVAVLHQPRAHETGTSADGQGGLSGQTGDAQASPHQTPGDRPQADDRAGRPARTQVDTTARDGSQGGGTSGTPRPADPPTSGRSARLDVSM